MKNITRAITWSAFPEYPQALLSVLDAILQAKFKSDLISEACFFNTKKAIIDTLQGPFDWQILGHSDLALSKDITEAVVSKIGAELQAEAKEALCLAFSTYGLCLTAKELAIRKELLLLLNSTKTLQKSLIKKSEDFSGKTRYARNHLNDAGQIRYSTMFRIFEKGVSEQAEQIRASLKHWNTNYLSSYKEGLEEEPPKHPGFQSFLRQQLEIEFNTSLEDFHDHLDFLNFGLKLLNSHALIQGLSTQVWRIANDLRILASGPRGGLSEVTLPAVAPGSSIMPGKLNPVIAEMIYGTCDQVDANHAGISLSLKSGWLETSGTSAISLKAYLQSVRLLRRSMDCFVSHCLIGVELNNKNRML